MARAAEAVVLAVPITIVRWVSDDQPGFVEGMLRDAYGVEWRFVDKVPVICRDEITAADVPCAGVLACEQIGEVAPGLIRISTVRPWGIETGDGTDEFVVAADQLFELR